MHDFTTNFLSIANNPANFVGNEPARLIYSEISEYAEREAMARADAVAYLSTRPNYGDNRGGVGGVNARYVDDAQSNYDVEYTTSDDSTWMNLYLLVEQALSCLPNSLPGWFEAEWIKAAEA